jgi:hypothetical protein
VGRGGARRDGAAGRGEGRGRGGIEGGIEGEGGKEVSKREEAKVAARDGQG